MVVEEAPHTGIADAASAKIGEGIGQFPREVLVLAFEPPHGTSILDDILRIQHVLLVLQGEASDAALVGVTTDGLVGNSASHPHHTFLRLLAVGTTALHLQYPSLVGVADGECLTLGIVAILFYQRRHDANGLAGCFRALQTDVDERTVVDESRGVYHLLTTAIGGLANGDLPLVDVAHHIVGLSSFGNLAQILVGVPLVYLAHVALLMLGSRIVCQVHEGTIGVGIVGTDDRAVHRGFLADNEIGAGQGIRCSHERCRKKNCSFHHYIFA